ncbi:MAG: SDR family NAD(P)-dependent oxidoreductase [Paludisphaera borealis]|uniref:SDR family NAD(P)-dependent oxidoreductase n=1 Tax=Paludisphaera borealis TaxID=1387353 RepID=UPI0028425A42|nr:SDR family NAD(P)-dependent oxidoreductase [Paludisphaera borealis]MDR3620443.1 SDR family NAD(P)-dependent oxidoreductase [Paludisphaera borealis]
MTASTSPVVLITGAANGIGRATALELARKNVPLGLLDVDVPNLETLGDELRKLGARFSIQIGDVCQRESLREAIAAVETAVGPIDVLVACAGFGRLTLVPDLALDTLRKTFDVNLFGVAESIEAVLPGMIARGRGHLVGVASLAGYRGFPWMISYSASKAALIAYLEALRPGLARRGVTITTVCPGFVRTAMSTGIPYKRKIDMLEPEVAAKHLARAVLRRPRNCVFPFSMRIGLAVLKVTPDFMFDWMMRKAGPEALSVDF